MLSCWSNSLIIPYSLIVLDYHDLHWVWLPRDSYCLGFFPHLFPFQSTLAIMPCSKDSSLAGSTKLSVYFTVKIVFPFFFKFPTPFERFLDKTSRFKLNTIGEKQHSLPIFTLLVSLWPSHFITLWLRCNLLIKLQQFSLRFALIWSSLHGKMHHSMKQVLKFSSMSKFRSHIILNIPIVSLFLFFSKPKLMFYKYFPNFPFDPSSKKVRFCCVCDKADHAMVDAVCSFYLLLLANMVTSMKSMGHFSIHIIILNSLWMEGSCWKHIGL